MSLRAGSKIVRVSDQKVFEVTLPAHWSDIKAADGEADSVKWYGGSGTAQDPLLLVSASRGFSYKYVEEP
jgi:hypothetical protein